MKTQVIKLDKNNIDLDKLRVASEVIRKGGLVAFPTETVYGLGANALNGEAVQNIFKAKGRPSDNPLIVHIGDKSSLEKFIDNIPEGAEKLMDAFWPGPLTIIMEKSKEVPKIVTAGLDTVAVRIPSHPVALALIKESGMPVAAPSANLSGKPSPTHANHVISDLSGKVDVIIDAGDSNIGLESTVIDLTTYPPMILRPGGITHEQLKEVLPEVIIDPALLMKQKGNFTPKSPGMKYTHYSPDAEVVIVEGKLEHIVEKINELVKINEENGLSVGILATEQTKTLYKDVKVLCMGDRDKPETIAANLFRLLREFDELGVQLILAESVEHSGIGLAVMNRMNKAAGYNIIKV